jgi:hypothetical protein
MEGNTDERQRESETDGLKDMTEKQTDIRIMILLTVN